MGNRYSFLFVLLTFIVTFIFALMIVIEITHVPFTLDIYLSHFELFLSTEIFSEIAHGLVYDEMILSIIPEHVLISENNNNNSIWITLVDIKIRLFRAIGFIFTLRLFLGHGFLTSPIFYYSNFQIY